ncbi:MAG: hypothetical protein O7G85_06550 [Planctomycetota bacterium]|nr:hypothetical protein [Planctomycetota bacterium]
MNKASEFWADRGSLWYRAMKRKSRHRIWLFGFFVIILGISIFYYISVVWRFGETSETPGVSTFVRVLWAVVFYLLAHWAVRRYGHGRNRLLQKIIDSKSSLCPICLCGMTDSGSNGYECSTCHRVTTRSALSRYFQDLGFDGYAAKHWLRDYKAEKKDAKELIDRQAARLLSDDLFISVSYMLVCWLISLAVLAGILKFLFVENFLISMIESVFPLGRLAFVLTGATLLINGFVLRKGQSLHCIYCEYQKAPSGPELVRCPECGAFWNVVGAFVKGVKTGTPSHFVVGLFLVIIGWGFSFNPLSGSSWRFKFMSTNSLIDSTVELRILVNSRILVDVWDELRSRSLSSEQYYSLAEGLLDLRVLHGGTFGQGGVWLDIQVMENDLSDDLLTRYYEESLVLELTGPDQSLFGESVEIGLLAERRSIYTLSGLYHHIVLGDFFVNEQGVPNSRVSEAILPFQLTDTEHVQDTRLLLTLEDHDSVTIRREVWIIIDSDISIDVIVWQADGSPLLPQGVVWSKKITLEHTIEISD